MAELTKKDFSIRQHGCETVNAQFTDSVTGNVYHNELRQPSLLRRIREEANPTQRDLNQLKELILKAYPDGKLNADRVRCGV